MKQQTSALAILAILTLALAIATDLFLFPTEQIGSGMSANLLNHALNTGLWFMLLAVPMIVLFIIWHVVIDVRYMIRSKPKLQ